MRFTKTNAPANGRAASWRMPRAGPANGPMPRCNARGPESAAPRGPQPPAVRAALSEPALQAATPRRTVKGLPGFPRRRPPKDTEPPPATRAQSRPPLSSPHKRKGGGEGPAARGEEICERHYGRPARPADGPNDAESQASACYSPLRPAAQSDEVLPS